MSNYDNIDQINRMYGMNLQYPAQQEEEIHVPEGFHIGKKVAITSGDYEGWEGVIEGLAPDNGNTIIYKVKVNDMIIPGWLKEAELKLL